MRATLQEDGRTVIIELSEVSCIKVIQAVLEFNRNSHSIVHINYIPDKTPDRLVFYNVMAEVVDEGEEQPYDSIVYDKALAWVEKFNG